MNSEMVCLLSVGQVVEFNECPDTPSEECDRNGVVTAIDIAGNSFLVKPNNPEWSFLLKFDIDGSSWDETGEFKLERGEFFFYVDNSF